MWVISRRLPGQLGQGWGEGVLRSALRLLVGVCAITAGVAAVGRLVLGPRNIEQVVINFHVLDALGAALLITALLLILAALLIVFPPGGALVVAGGGTIAAGSAVSVASVLQAAGILGLAGIRLMVATGGGGGKWQRWWYAAEQPGTEPAVPRRGAGGAATTGRRLTKPEIRRVHDEISGQTTAIARSWSSSWTCSDEESRRDGELGRGGREPVRGVRFEGLGNPSGMARS